MEFVFQSNIRFVSVLENVNIIHNTIIKFSSWVAVFYFLRTVTLQVENSGDKNNKRDDKVAFL